MKENKNLINVVFEESIFNKKSKETETKISSSAFSFDDVSKAEEAFSSLKEKNYMDFETPYGKIAFRMISIELLNTDKYDNYSEGIKDDS